MSLGKGLESLIPPPNQSKHDSGQAHQSSDEHGAGQAPQGSDDNVSGNDDFQPADSDTGRQWPQPGSVGDIQSERPRQVFGKHEHIAPTSSSGLEPQVLSFDFSGGDGSSMSADDSSLDDSGLLNEAVDEVAPANDVSAVPVQQSREEEEKKTEYAGEVQAGHVYHIEVSKISPNPSQPRRNFSEDGITDLARSIREFGFLQPLVVSRKEVESPQGIDIEYQLIAGERRLHAAKKLGLERVPAIIREVDLEREKLELAVIENIQREDLNPIERARAFQRLQEEFRMTQREIAAKLGKSRETVANTVRLLDLPAYVQEALERGQITESHGRFLLQISDPAAQKNLFDDIVLRGLTTRDVKRRVKREKTSDGVEEGAAADVISPELKAFEERLTAELGTPVRIERGENNGKITITFYSDEELQNILEKFGKIED